MNDSVIITTLAERPDYTDRLYEVRDAWPAFMHQMPLANALVFGIAARFPRLTVLATADGVPVGRARAIAFRRDLDGRRGPLPDQGWDRVLSWTATDLQHGREPDCASAIEMGIDRDHLGRGLSHRLLAALRDAAGAAGFTELVAPVRPTAKHLEQDRDMTEYAFATRDDGLPVDPWLRVHVRAGGVIDRVAPVSSVLGGSLAQWREWTGLPFDRTGPVLVPGALVPVACDVDRGHAVYVEPNVWVRHRLG